MEIVSEAFSHFAREQLNTPPEPFRQDPRLKAAIEKLCGGARSDEQDNKMNPVLPRRRMELHEVSLIIQGRVNSTATGSAQIPPEQIIQNGINERRKIIAKIELILNTVNQAAEEQRTPELLIRNQKLWSNCIYDADRVTLKSVANAKQTVVKYSTDKSRFSTIVFVLSKVHDLLSKNLTCTRRELYYQNVTRIRSQSTLDVAVRDVCCLLNYPPWSLGITATAKGLITGPLTIITRDGTSLDCMASGGTLIPQDVVGIKSFSTSAKYILVVEKDAIFQKLLDEGALERLGPVIIMTGKGYPDVCTRQLLVRLTTELCLPALGLFDADPHGLEIFLTYKYGSLAQSHISVPLACSRLGLLGLRCGQVTALAPASSRMPLTQRDLRKLNALINRPYLSNANGASLLAEARAMLQSGHKAELESLATLSPAYLTDSYLPSNIIAHNFLL